MAESFLSEPRLFSRQQGQRYLLAALLAICLQVAQVWLFEEADVMRFGDGKWLRPAASTLRLDLLPSEPRELELPEAAPPEPEPEERRFVETNPEVPENEPAPTINESNRDQQAAQPDPDPLSESEIPSVLGGEDPDNYKVLRGEQMEASPPLPPGHYYGSLDGLSLQDSKPLQPTEVLPLKGPKEVSPFEEEPPEVEEGHSPLPKEVQEEQPQTERRVVDLIRNPQVQVVEEEVGEDILAEAARQGVPVPKPRPRLRFDLPPGPLREQPIRTSRVGTVAVEAEFTEFGDYTSRMVEAVSNQWHLIVERHQYAERDLQTVVALHFRLDKEGRVYDMVVERSTASRVATLACQDAVLSRVPFDAWTDDMVATHGDSVGIHFTFHYR